MTFGPRAPIVTGADSDSGIGRAVAVELARAGMDIGVTWHRDCAGAEKTAVEVREHGPRVEVVRLDTTEIPGCGDVIDAPAERLGGVDVFSTPCGPTRGALICLLRAALRMAAGGQGGRLVAISCVHEHQPRVGASADHAAKPGLGGLGKPSRWNSGSTPSPPIASRRARSPRP